MSTLSFAEMLRSASTPESAEVDSGLAMVPLPHTTAWDPAYYAQEQISALVRRVFFPGWPQPSKQVVFTAVDAGHDIASICRRVGETLASQIPGQSVWSMLTPGRPDSVQPTSLFGPLPHMFLPANA